MATVITAGAATISPTIVLGYESAREAQSIVHVILGRASPDLTLRPALMRSGTLSLGFAGATSESDSLTAEGVLSAGTSNLALVSTDRASIAMTFGVVGTVRRHLEDESRNAWLIDFEFQEV